MSNFYLKNLEIGDIVEAKITTMTVDDIGFSGLTFKTKGTIKGKKYKVVDKIISYDYPIKGRAYYVVDETGCRTLVDDFRFVKIDKSEIRDRKINKILN